MHSVQESIQAWRQDAAKLADLGVFFPSTYRAYITPDMKLNDRIAMDAQAALSTTANSDIPNILNTPGSIRISSTSSSRRRKRTKSFPKSASAIGRPAKP